MQDGLIYGQQLLVCTRVLLLKYLVISSSSIDRLKIWTLAWQDFVRVVRVSQRIKEKDIANTMYLIMSPLRTKGDILLSDFFFFCFFSAKLVRTITFLSSQIGQLYLVCVCMTIRRCVAYHYDLRGTSTFDLKVK
jgi:hypothetical protein